MSRVSPFLSLAAAALFTSFLAGCGGSAASSSACGAHQYSYVGGGVGINGGTTWYDGDWGGGWYDPGDDGTDYGDEGSGANGSGDDGSGDDGSYSSGDDSSGDDSTDDGSGDDSSGDDSSGGDDDDTSAKKHLHTSNAKLHIAGVTAATNHNACYAYSCDLICAVGSPAVQEREALGYSATSFNDACETAAHGVETWAHDSVGADVSACKQVTGNDTSANPPAANARTPAAPSVIDGFNASSSSTRPSATIHAPR